MSCGSFARVAAPVVENQCLWSAEQVVSTASGVPTEARPFNGWIGRAGVRLQEHNTFFVVCEESEPRLPRSRSDPCLLHAKHRLDVTDQEDSNLHGGAHLEKKLWGDDGSVADSGSTPSFLGSDEVDSESVDDCDSCSTASSDMDLDDCGSDEDVVFVGETGLASKEFTQAATSSTSSREISLQDFLALPKLPSGERLSIGSLGHHYCKGPCKVCVFHGKEDKVCRAGVLCTFCHCEHTPYIRRRAKKHKAQD